MKGALRMGHISLSLSEDAQCRGPQGSAPLLEALGYEKALGLSISLHGGSVGQPVVGSSTGDFERWLIGALEVEHPLSMGAL